MDEKGGRKGLRPTVSLKKKIQKQPYNQTKRERRQNK